MANIFNTIKWRFRTTAIRNLIIKNEVRNTNLTRSVLISGLSVLVAAIILFYYHQKLVVTTTAEIYWRSKVVIVHLYTMVIFLMLFLMGNYIRKSGIRNSYTTEILSNLVFLTLLQWGTFCTIYDQLIGTSMVPFLLACLISTMSLLLRPIHVFIGLGIAYVLFYKGITATQNHPRELIFNAINGLCIVFIAFALALIFWKTNLARFIQSRLLAQSTKELKKANTNKDKFFSILAHDLKGPINSTLALTELLESGGFENDDKERQKVYKLLQSSLYNSAKLLDDVLLWARTQSDNITFKPVELNLHQTIESCVNILKIVAAHKDINIHNLTDRTVMIFADQDMIHTIFRNLLSNAIKFTPNFGFIHVKDEILKKGDTKKEMIGVAVIDSGVGMDSATLNNLFTIEHKITALGTNNETGTGLGLVLCKDFVEKHGGSIQVESVKNEGSKFTVYLPF